MFVQFHLSQLPPAADPLQKHDQHKIYLDLQNTDKKNNIPVNICTLSMLNNIATVSNCNTKKTIETKGKCKATAALILAHMLLDEACSILKSQHCIMYIVGN